MKSGIPTFKFPARYNCIIPMIDFKVDRDDGRYERWLSWKKENGRKLILRRIIGNVKNLFRKLLS